eukprot:TRINITY_DN30873_c0_g1_i1.p1 TRINITY_DN30873_c0_g1~~TRINITY_DN30873_c0_g1_i1.p1  ORF type:complete len:865 (+),score=214.80 TRINITY_DN30873_c0_g1_i1:68-2662(+)
MGKRGVVAQPPGQQPLIVQPGQSGQSVAAPAAAPAAQLVTESPQAKIPQQSRVPPSGEQPPKRVKKETKEQTPATPSRPHDPNAAPEPAQKRLKQKDDSTAPGTPGNANPALAPTPARGATSTPKALKVKSKRSVSGGIAWVLTEVRSHLEAIPDVEGVKDILDKFPECVLLGGISARRELVGALLGEHAVANAAAAVLVAPGMRQPVALELRSNSKVDMSFQGPQADTWLRSISNAAQQALGNRLKAEPLRIRLTLSGCANLDVIDLPEKCGSGINTTAEPTPPKVVEMRNRHLGSPSNLLVCLEPGPPLDLCKRFDPLLKRTVLIGAAASSAKDTMPASTLCGPAAATDLEERFAALCQEKVPQWIAGLEKLETRLSRSSTEAKDMEQRDAPEEVLRTARSAGLSFGRALQEVISGAPGCRAGSLTLEEELIEFASAAAKGFCGTGGALSSSDAAAAAADLFAQFEGVEGYAAYLRNEIKIPGADVSLNGGAAWQRLLAEVEVSMRLAHPPPEELKDIMNAAVRAGGTGVHGHTRWEDVAAKLMLGIAFDPLLRRIRYIAARIVWVLKHQKAAVSEWMSSMSEGPAARIYSPMYGQHLNVLRQSPIVRDLVFGAYDDAVAIIGQGVLKNLAGTLTAACINPGIMLRPRTQVDIDPSKPLCPTLDSAKTQDSSTQKDKNAMKVDSELPSSQASKSGKSGSSSSSGRATQQSARNKEARLRVTAEMTRRSGSSGGGLPRNLQDRVFNPKEAAATVPAVSTQLKKAFAVLADILANQAFAFSDASLSTLCRRQVDEAMNAIELSSEQMRVLGDRHMELLEVSRQVSDRLTSVRRCLSSLRTVEAKPASVGVSMNTSGNPYGSFRY